MKQKIVKMIVIPIGVILLSALLSIGILFLVMNRNVKESGNVLGISWYNETTSEFTISTAQELYEFAKLSDFYSFENQTIKLDADLVLNEGNATDWEKDSPKNLWKPIRGFAGTFDGQGHTISGLYGKAYESKMALFIDADYHCTIQNLKLTNSYFETSGFQGTASFLAGVGGNLSGLYSDAIFNHKGENVGGIASGINKQSTISECWFNGIIHTTLRDCGGIIDEISGARVSVKHCLFSGEIHSDYTTAGTRMGGLCGRLVDAGVLIVEDSLITGVVDVLGVSLTGGVVGSTNAGTEFHVRDTYLAKETHRFVIGEEGSGGAIVGNVLPIGKQYLTGSKGYEWTTLDFDNYWSAVDGGNPELSRFSENPMNLTGVKKAYDVSWYTKDKGTYEISNREQLYGMYYISAQDDFTNKTIKLVSDIKVNDGNAKDWEAAPPDMAWESIPVFAGIFDGQGYSIEGIYQNTNTNRVGLFGLVNPGGALRNFSLKNSYFGYYSEPGDKKEVLISFGSICGDLRGEMKSVYSNATVVSNGSRVGGLVGVPNAIKRGTKHTTVTISDCWFDGSVKTIGDYARFAGGIAGRAMQGNIEIHHCLNTGNISTERKSGGSFTGGIIGSDQGAKVSIEDCLNTGAVTAKLWSGVGAIVGFTGMSASDKITEYRLWNVYATDKSCVYPDGSVKLSNQYMGKLNGDAIAMKEEELVGVEAYKWTNLDFENYWVARNGKTPALKTFAGKGLNVANTKKMLDTDWYSEEKAEFVIQTPEQLYGFATLSLGCSTFEGKTVKLGKSISMHDYANWKPIGHLTNGFKGTFDGQGHTISHVTHVTSDTRGGLFSFANTGSVIKNFRLTDSSFTYQSENGNKKEVLISYGSVCGDLRGKLEAVYSNADVTSNGSRVGGLVGVPNAPKVKEQYTTVTISECWFDGSVKTTGDYARYAGGIAGRPMQGNIHILHCLNSGTVSTERKTGGSFTGGIIGSDQGAKIRISDCLNTGKVTGKLWNGVGAVVGMTGFSASAKITEYDIDEVYALNSSCVNPNGSAQFVNKYVGITKGNAFGVDDNELLGVEGYRWTNLDFEKHWSAREGEIPAPKPFVSNPLSIAGAQKMFDASWYSDDAKELVIETPAQFYGFAVLSASVNFKGQTVKLGKDISMAAYPNWKSIGNNNSKFTGTFDGQGYTISNVHQTTNFDRGGLFAIVDTGGKLQNFRVIDSSFTYHKEDGDTKEYMISFGAICGDLRGSLEKVYCKASVTSNGSRVGGLVGVPNGANNTTVTISNSWFDGNVALTGAKAYYAGGIAGRAMQGTIKILHCLNTGTVSSQTAAGGTFIGGIIGSDQGAKVILQDCLNTGTVSSTNSICIGSLVGGTGFSASAHVTEYEVTNCYALESNLNPVNKYVGSLKQKDVWELTSNELKNLNGYKNTKLDFDQYWIARKDDTPALKSFVAEGLSVDGVVRINTDWYSSAKDLYIDNEAELYGFAKLVNGGNSFKGQTVHLTNDLTLNKVEDDTLNKWRKGEETPINTWTPIGNGSIKFQGTFDGGKHEISGVYVNTTVSQYVGLFGRCDAPTVIKDVYLTDSYIKHDNSGGYWTGSIVGMCYGGTLEGLYTNAIVETSAQQIGGIVGRMEGTIKECWFDGELKSTKTSVAALYMGGIVGGANKVDYTTISITDCLNTGKMNFDVNLSGSSLLLGVGGIFGVTLGNLTSLTIQDCISAGEINFKNNTYAHGIGMIIGFSSRNGIDCTFSNCYARNDVLSGVGADNTYKLIGKDLSSDKAAKNEFNNNATTCKSMSLAALEEVILTDWVARTNDVPVPKRFDRIVVLKND